MSRVQYGRREEIGQAAWLTESVRVGRGGDAGQRDLEKTAGFRAREFLDHARDRLTARPPAGRRDDAVATVLVTPGLDANGQCGSIQQKRRTTGTISTAVALRRCHHFRRQSILVVVGEDRDDAR